MKALKSADETRSNCDDPYDSCTKRSNTKSSSTFRHLPHKVPSIIKEEVFTELLNCALTFLPGERAVFLVAIQLMCDSGIAVVFCVKFITIDVHFPITSVRLERNQAHNVRKLKKYFKLCIEDLSILNLNVIGSISDPSEMFVNIFAQLNKDLNEKELTSAITYTVLPYKYIVHIFCYKSLERKFNELLRKYRYTYFISGNNYNSEDIIYDSMVLTRTGLLDIIRTETGIEDTDMSTEQFCLALQRVISKKIGNDIRAPKELLGHMWTLNNSLKRHSEITRDRLSEILQENSELLDGFASVRFSNVQIRQSDLHEPMTPLVDHYETYLKLVSNPQTEVETSFPSSPYYLLSKQTRRQFMKASGCVGKRSETIRKEIAQRAERHRNRKRPKDTNASSENLDEKILNLLTFVRERLTVSLKDDSRAFNETTDDGGESEKSIDVEDSLNNNYIGVFMALEENNDTNQRDLINCSIAADNRSAQKITSSDADIKSMKNLNNEKSEDIQTEGTFNSRAEITEPFSTVIEIMTVILANVEDIAVDQSRRIAYNFLMSSLDRVAEPVDIFQQYIATYKGYHRLFNKMLKYNIKSVKANVFHLSTITDSIALALASEL